MHDSLNKVIKENESKGDFTYAKALGLTKDNSNLLAEQMVFDFEKATKTITNEYGTKFSQIVSIQGANGRIIDVKFIWIQNNDGVIRLVTSIPTEKRGGNLYA